MKKILYILCAMQGLKLQLNAEAEKSILETAIQANCHTKIAGRLLKTNKQTI